MAINKLNLTFKNKTNPPTTTDPIINAENLNKITGKIDEIIDNTNISFGNGVKNEENIKSGSCYYAKFGDLVLVRLDSIKANQDLSGTDVLFTGLPADWGTAFGNLTDMANNDTIMIAISSGNVRMNYDHLYQAGSYDGVLWYRAK